jgi:predicted CopG family antitoxin
MKKYNSILVSEETYNQLKRLGETADSFNDVIKKLLINRGGIKSKYE